MTELSQDLPNIKAAQLNTPTLEQLAPVGDLSHPPRILMLYGSLRERSFSRFLTYEAARILEHFGAEVRIFGSRSSAASEMSPVARSACRA